MRRRGLLDDGYDDETYLNTLEAEAKSWAERHFEDDAAEIARAARTRARELVRRPPHPPPPQQSVDTTTGRAETQGQRRGEGRPGSDETRRGSLPS